MLHEVNSTFVMASRECRSVQAAHPFGRRAIPIPLQPRVYASLPGVGARGRRALIRCSAAIIDEALNRALQVTHEMK